MKGFKEFKSRIESDAEFAAKFKDVENESQAIALAKAEGYDLTQLSDEDLDAIAGGGLLDAIWGAIKKVAELDAKIVAAPIIDIKNALK